MSDPIIFIFTVFGTIRLIISFSVMVCVFPDKFPDKPKDLFESFKRICFVMFALEYGFYTGMKYFFEFLKDSFVPEGFKLPSFPKFPIKKFVAKESKVNLLKEDNQYRNAHCEDCNCK